MIDLYVKSLFDMGRADVTIMVFKVHMFLQCNYLESPVLMTVIFGA